LAAQEAAMRLPPSLLLGAPSVAGYHPEGGEMDPMPVLRRFAAAGARLVLPAATDRDAALVFRAWAEGDLLAPDAFGIASPRPERPEIFPDIVIAPVLAFDRRGGRLGQGAGCFDRTLVGLRAAGRVFVIGLAFSDQEIDQTPMEPHDQGLDAILTESGYIEVRKDL
jgi:5-formyltetrahydrofolate cyclo-ligase